MSDNPQAFPTAIAVSVAGDEYHGADGMTLRDYFAGQALIALPNIGCGADLDIEDTALAAYQIADAMLAARENKVQS